VSTPVPGKIKPDRPALTLPTLILRRDDKETDRPRYSLPDVNQYISDQTIEGPSRLS
jgi:hypothetical protein